MLCACWRFHVLIASMCVIFGGGEAEPREEDQTQKEKKKDEYTRTNIPVGTGYRMVPDTAVCSEESTAQHGTAPQGKARRCAALQSYSWAELSCESIFCDSTYSIWYVQQ